jgi:aminomethyltransferase
MLKRTPLYQRTAALMEGHAWRRWAGYTVASSYELNHDREYAAIRNSAALLDVSPLYKYRLTGRDAGRLLDRVVTRDVAKMKVGQVGYTPWCDAHGKVIDDGTVSRLGDATYRLTSAEPNIRWLYANAHGCEVAIEDVSESTAALALQGPLSRDILKAVVDGADIGALRFFRLTSGAIRGVPVVISRTGYTGDLGYEIWIDAPKAIAVWDALVEAGASYGIAPAGIYALDIARIEAGLIMLDVDYISAHRALIPMQLSTPFEINLGWAVALDKAPFVGQRALREEHERGAAWRFVGVEVEWESLERLFAAVGLPPRLPTIAWRTSVPLYVDGRQVGYATSGCWSPLLKKMIALAHVEAAFALPGTPVQIEVTVEHRRRQADARVAALPFFNPDRKRA